MTEGKCRRREGRPCVCSSRTRAECGQWFKCHVRMVMHSNVFITISQKYQSTSRLFGSHSSPSLCLPLYFPALLSSASLTCAPFVLRCFFYLLMSTKFAYMPLCAHGSGADRSLSVLGELLRLQLLSGDRIDGPVGLHS